MIQKIKPKWLAAVLALAAISGAEESSSPGASSGVPQITGTESGSTRTDASKAGEAGKLAEIRTIQGAVYSDCQVLRVETDALLIRHRNGMAKVSFFDLDTDLRKRYGFDPVAGMKKRRTDLEQQRERRWEQFWEREKWESEKKSRQELEDFQAKARREWMPITARVLRRTDRGAFVQASRITFVPTKTKSTLGFEIDGPPKKQLVPFKPDVIFIEATGIDGEFWQGYLDPVTRESISNGHDESIPVHRAVAHSESP